MLWLSVVEWPFRAPKYSPCENSPPFLLSSSSSKPYMSQVVRVNTTDRRIKYDGTWSEVNGTLLLFRIVFATGQTQQPATINLATTHTFTWHSQHKKSIQHVSTTYPLGYPGVTMEFGRTFCKDEKTKSAPKFHCYPRVS